METASPLKFLPDLGIRSEAPEVGNKGTANLIGAIRRRTAKVRGIVDAAGALVARDLRIGAERPRAI